MYIWLILALLLAALEAMAVSKNAKRSEYIAKPAVMIGLFLWLYASTGLQGNTFWYGLAILFSLIGDVLLMLPSEKLFLPGLIAFLLAHLAYIMGFRAGLRILNAWALILLAIIAVTGSCVLRRIIGAMRGRGQKQLTVPVMAYGIIISFMLYTAASTLYNPAWRTGAALLVSAGAFMFGTSDALLAWNKFVAPLQSGRVASITLYHLGQMGLVAGAIAQFG